MKGIEHWDFFSLFQTSESEFFYEDGYGIIREYPIQRMIISKNLLTGADPFTL